MGGHPSISGIGRLPGPRGRARGAGGWWFSNVNTDANFGSVAVNCTHTDSKGSIWSAY